MTSRPPSYRSVVGDDSFSSGEDDASRTRPFQLKALAVQDGLNHPPATLPAWASVCLISFPVLATLAWAGTLLALLLTWIFVDQRAAYDFTQGLVPYFSAIAVRHQNILVPGSIATAIFYFLSLLAERFLRTMRVTREATDEKILWAGISGLDVTMGGLAALALVLLATFDTQNGPIQHNAFSIMFIVCVTLSGILQTVEVEHLWHEHPDRHDLRDGTILKWIILSLSSAAGLSFVFLGLACHADARQEPWPRCYRIITASAIFQWVACFGVAFYFATLILDLHPLHRHSLRATPVAWADRSGIRGLYLPSTETPFEIEKGWSVRRCPARGTRVVPVAVQAEVWSAHALEKKRSRRGERRRTGWVQT
ncbi:frag1/DRAM/Sfk1 family protein [Rhodotorula toruloides]|uniref:Frag1/DRAM/Sfk1 family protein n=1 Tax=Rhodotorula toruloides TaxID=5286 RepID=A0A511KKD7_RHOTO|nr:frag1/DRAM/Sfk1 family protein [Rhodotorula toruloides]